MVLFEGRCMFGNRALDKILGGKNQQAGEDEK